MKDLFQKYIDNQCSEEEMRELFRIFSIDSNSSFIRNKIASQFECNENDEPANSEKQKVIDSIFNNILIEISRDKVGKTGKVAWINRKRWVNIAAAAVLTFVLAGSIWFFADNKTEKEVIPKEKIFTDIAPGGDKATLTLADGTTIILDSATNGNLANQGNAKVIKIDGKLSYSATGKSAETLYNTISTPRGGQYQLILSDGTKVWLNAASSLRFPTTFFGDERKVYLTGEGYFEVAKNTAMPFKVNVAGKSEVQVLGTHFNINSYADEATINTTLIEGSIRVTGLTTHASRLIAPGQQAQFSSNGQINLIKNADIDEVLAWKNGKFEFGEATDIKIIMRQIARWYDLEVEFRGIVTEHIGGTISRNVNVSKVLEMLEMTGGVKFQIDGKKVVVIPQKK